MSIENNKKSKYSGKKTNYKFNDKNKVNKSIELVDKSERLTDKWIKIKDVQNQIILIEKNLNSQFKKFDKDFKIISEENKKINENIDKLQNKILKLNNLIWDYEQSKISSLAIENANLILESDNSKQLDNDSEITKEFATIISLTHNLSSDKLNDKVIEWKHKFSLDGEIINNEDFIAHMEDFFTLERVNHLDKTLEIIEDFINEEVLISEQTFTKFINTIEAMSKKLEIYFPNKYYSKDVNSLSSQLVGYLRNFLKMLTQKTSPEEWKDLGYTRVTRATQIIESLMRNVSFLIRENEQNYKEQSKSINLNDFLIKMHPKKWNKIFDNEFRLVLRYFLAQKIYDESAAIRNDFAHNTKAANEMIYKANIQINVQTLAITLLVFNQVYVNRHILKKNKLDNTQILKIKHNK
ncbi:hypothetical protein EI74_0604 [Mycoplasma testudineum]|uniref:Uncharacterized protein n=1 Tax=Mycoplasma testudineum TaxID=244584 RepID=A0A4R6IC38_9MOLU|nr:hypothetical protein [Mycoplasma testudineum]OYD26671.1 hypothetical protein CG473_02620 [Mycoplasma testudineum]TDO19800.1 hypothetical protein EI74_0604 [Mycoplasma testudineum]